MRIILKGGKGSGYFGHAGRPGKVGGSARRLDTKFREWISNPDNWQRKKGDKYHYSHGVSDSAKVHVKGDGDIIVKMTDSFSGNDPNSWYKEEDAFRIATELGFDIVPAGGHAVGPDFPESIYGGEQLSVQQWVDDATTLNEMHNILDSNKPNTYYTVNADRFEQIAWLDAIIGNTDRHGGNIVIKLNKKTNEIDAYAIDNGLAFFTEYWRKTKTARQLYEPQDIMDFRYKNVCDYFSSKSISIPYSNWHKDYYDRCINMITNPDSAIEKHLSARYGDTFMIEALQRVYALDDYLTKNNLYGK